MTPLLYGRRLREQVELILLQKQLIHEQRQEMRRLHLEYTREIQGMVSAWIIGLEQPELDLRDDLHILNGVLSDKIAEMEEHVV